MPERRAADPLRAVYNAKRASSVRSAFLWEPWGARLGWAGWAPGGDGRESAALALSSRNLSNSAGNKWICQRHRELRDHQCCIFNQNKWENEENFTRLQQIYTVISLYLHWSPLPLAHLLSISKKKKTSWDNILVKTSSIKGLPKRQNQTTGNSVEGKVPVIMPVKFTVNHASFHTFCRWRQKGTVLSPQHNLNTHKFREAHTTNVTIIGNMLAFVSQTPQDVNHWWKYIRIQWKKRCGVKED